MELKKILEELVETIEKATGETREDISINTGYGRTYISECLSPTGKATEKFIKALKKQYAEILENPNNPKFTFPGGTELLAQMKNEILWLQASIKVLTQTLAEVKSKTPNGGVSVSKAILEIEKNTEDAHEALLKKLRKKDRGE